MMTRTESGAKGSDKTQWSLDGHAAGPASPLLVSIWQNEDGDWRLVDYNEALLVTTDRRLTGV